MSKKDKRYEKFVEAYVIEQNATKAAIAAGYSKKTAYAAGSRLLKNVEVQQKLQQRHNKVVAKLEETNDITIERVMKELARIAFFDPRQLFDEKGQLLPIHKIPAEIAAAIAGLDQVEMLAGAQIGEDGIKIVDTWCKKVKLANKLDALQMIGKQLGMFREKGQGDSQDIFNLIINLSDGAPVPKVIEHKPHQKSSSELPTINL